MADPKGSKVSVATDVAGVHAKNAINVAMEDLSEEGRKGIEKELEEEMAERRRQKLACFQKTRHGVVKKVDTIAASKVNSSLSPKDLVQLVNVSVASKYGADLTQLQELEGQLQEREGHLHEREELDDITLRRELEVLSTRETSLERREAELERE
jgi:hypothetical protein